MKGNWFTILFDSYSIKGRLLPAFFSMVIPIMIFNHFFISEEFSQFVGGVLGAKIISNLTISSVCLYFICELGRFIAKNVFEKIYFKQELCMPTTNFLLFNDDTYSDDYKKRMHEKIFKDFKVILLTKDEELSNQQLARKKIVEIMALIRKKLHNNKFLLKHNIEYGAMRNTIGGSVIGIFFSIFNIIFFSIYFKNNLAVCISVFTFFVYILFIFFSKIIIDFYGKNYAKILFREYMGVITKKTS